MEHYPFANGYVRKISVVKWFPDGVEQCRRNAISKYFQIESALWRKVVVATPSSTFSHSFVSVYKRLRDIRARVLIYCWEDVYLSLLTTFIHIIYVHIFCKLFVFYFVYVCIFASLNNINNGADTAQTG